LVPGGDWFTTRSGILRGQAGWEDIAPYADPIARFLEKRYPMMPSADREDLLQDVLMAMKTHLVEKYDTTRGGFRPYLRTAIVNRVKDHYRRKKVRAGTPNAPEPAAPETDEHDLHEDDADALDLEACLLGALHAFHDKRARTAKPEDLELLYAFSGSLVEGLSNEEIATREKKSKDQVKRLLQRARDEILREFMQRAAPGIEAKAPLERSADLVRRIFREPRRRARIIEAESNRVLADAVDRFMDRLEKGRARLPVLASTAGKEFEEALRAVFNEDQVP
jgi:RNA polymerase sigma factor (sigma-70 family)